MDQIQDILNNIQYLSKDIKELHRLIKKIGRGEVIEKDEILTSKKFQKEAAVSQRSMYYILEIYPHLKSKKIGFGILINYTKYKKLLGS